MNHYIKKHKMLLILTVLLGVTSTTIWVYFSKIMEYLIVESIDINFKKNIFFVIIYIGIVRLFSYLSNYTKSISTNEIIKDFRNDYIKSIFQRNTLDDSSEILNDIDTKLTFIKNNYLENIILFITSITSFILSTVLLMNISVIVTFILYVLMFVVILIPKIIKQTLENKQTDVTNACKIYTKAIKDYLGGFDVIKNNNIEEYVNHDLENKSKSTCVHYIQLERLNYFLSETSHFFITLLSSTGFILGIYFVQKGTMSYGTMISIVQLTNTLSSPLYTIIDKLGLYYGSKSIVDDMLSKIETKTPHSNKLPLKEIKTITFQNVCYCCENKTILKNINFTIQKGKKYLLIGKSGSGKTTLLNMIISKYKPTTGTILINGLDASVYNEKAIQSCIGIIQQESHIFDGSIKDNLTLFNKYKLENDVLEQSQLSNYIQSLQSGLNTETFENGVRISGGEKQRISIARFLASKKQILLADEVTSALDKNTSDSIEKTILDCCNTIVYCSHKYDKILMKKFDYVIEIENGCIKSADSF